MKGDFITLKQETREKLLAEGCSITEEAGNLVVTCPLKILDNGIRIAGLKLVRVKKNEDKITLYFEKG